MIVDPRRVISAMMVGMIHRFGGYDAVVALFSARWGVSTSKGTLTKKASGELDWSLSNIIALEDALGDYPITRMLADRMQGGTPCDVQRAVAALAKEGGEAMASVLTQSDPALMLKEAREAAVAAQALVTALENRGDA
jgi:hypothetical protein